MTKMWGSLQKLLLKITRGIHLTRLCGGGGGVTSTIWEYSAWFYNQIKKKIFSLHLLLQKILSFLIENVLLEERSIFMDALLDLIWFIYLFYLILFLTWQALICTSTTAGAVCCPHEPSSSPHMFIPSLSKYHVDWSELNWGKEGGRDRQDRQDWQTIAILWPRHVC